MDDIASRTRIIAVECTGLGGACASVSAGPLTSLGKEECWADPLTPYTEGGNHLILLDAIWLKLLR